MVATILADHARSYYKGMQVEIAAHVEDLVQQKRDASHHRGMSRLTRSVPAMADLLTSTAAKGHHLASMTRVLGQMLDHFGAPAMQEAVLEALRRDVSHHNAVRLAFNRIRSYSANTADAHLAAEEQVVEKELLAVGTILSNIKLDLKTVAAGHDSKKPVHDFRENLAAAFVELDVDKPDDLETWPLTKRPHNSGSRYARSIIAYYSALWRTIEIHGVLPAPTVIDSPNQGAQDKVHLKMLLSVLAAKAPANTQVILAHEEIPEGFVADKVVVLSNNTRLLDAKGFGVVAPELFSYVERARSSLAGVVASSDDEPNNDLESGQD